MKIVCMKLIVCNSQVKVFVSRQDLRQQTRHISFFLSVVSRHGAYAREI
jgi:hypothetical protein